MKLILCIIFTLLIATNAKSEIYSKEIQDKILKLGLDISNENSTQISEQLINIWSKIEQDDDKFMPYIILPIKVWGDLFEKQYQKNNNNSQNARIGIYYSSILIDLSQYEKALEILKFAYSEKKRISKNEYKILLINLEQCYKSKNEISNAIQIRKELIQNKLLKNYWKIYKACGLKDAALEDFILFEEKQYYNGNKKIIKPNYYNNLSRLYFAKNNIDSAKKYAEIGLANIDKALNDESVKFLYKNEILQNWKALYTGFLGKCYMYEKKYLIAIPKLKYAVDYGKIDIESNTLSMIYLSLCYLNLKDLKNYKLYSNIVKNKINTLDAEDVTRSYYSASQEYYNKINKYDSAYKYLFLYSQFKDKITKGVQQNQSIFLLGQLEIQKRRLELIKNESENKSKNIKIVNLLLILSLLILIALFLTYVIYQNNKNKKSLTSKNELLEENIKKNQEHILHNDLLLKELHHRVKNNLQLMYSLLNLQKRRNENLEIKSNLSTVQNRIQTMALVHENLYNSGNFESVEALKYIETLANHLKAIYKQEDKNIEKIINIDTSIQLHIDIIISIGLIINEIISNSYKYAFNNEKGSKIEITLAKINDLIILEISDDGIGFSMDDVKEDSLGLKLVEIMCSQLKAKLNRNLNNGVKYTIEFNI